MGRFGTRHRDAMRLAFTLGLALLFSNVAEAQIGRPVASPRTQITQQLSMIEAKIDYGRPGVKGRKIFGELEPFGKVWRTGANASTKISFSGDVKIGDETLPAGTYALYTIPNKKSWTIIFSKNTKLWGAGGYNPSEDQLRVEARVQNLKSAAESLCIDFERFHPNGADLFIAWDRTKVTVPIFVDSDAAVLAEIDQKVKNAPSEPSAQTFFDAGMFYYEKKLDLAQAETWIDRAVELNPQAFWYVYYQGEVAYTRGKKAKAKESVSRALRAAESSSADFGYIAKCKMLLKKL